MKRSFPLIKLVSIVSGKFLPHGGYPGLMDICQFLIGRRNEASIDIPPILNATKVEILKQHSWIGEINVPNFRSLRELEKWSVNLLKKHDEMVEFKEPSITITKEEIQTQAIKGLCEATGISTEQLNNSINKTRKLLGIK